MSVYIFISTSLLACAMSAPPPLVVDVDADDDNKEQPFSFSLSSIPSEHQWRTINTAPSPKSEAEKATSSLTREQPIYRGTSLHDVVDEDEGGLGTDSWGGLSQRVRFGHKELTLAELDCDDDVKVTHRSMSLELPSVEVVDAPSLAPLPLPAVFDESYSFVSSSSASSLLSAVSSIIHTYPSDVSFAAHPTSPRVSGVFYHDNKPVSFRVSVFTAEAEESRVVEVQRRSGDMAAFHSLYRFIVDCMRRDGHFAAQTAEMDRMEPPSMGDDDDHALEMSVMDMWRIKAGSDRYTDARDGLHGLLTPKSAAQHEALFSSSELLPVIQHGIDSDYDAEQQRLAVHLLDSQLATAASSSPSHLPHHLLLPLVPSLLTTARTVPIEHHTHNMRTGLLAVLDALRSRHSALADAVEAERELLHALRAHTASKPVVGAC